MNETLITKLNEFGTDKTGKYNYLREYFQLLTLKILDENGYFRNIAFVGGTALRILYDLNRFSEDLDFCLIEKKNFSFHDMMQTVKKALSQENFDVEATTKENKTVGSAFIKFNQLLFNLGISPHKDEKLSIKIEIDQNPPKAFNTEFSMINKEFLIGINHYDLPSLFSGKLHAILCRAYTKGRDYYDLMWFLSRKIEPNYILLTNAIEQTEKTKIQLNRKKLIELLHNRINETDFRKIRLDIGPFLADSKEIRYFEKDFFLNLITAFPGDNENKL